MSNEDTTFTIPSDPVSREEIKKVIEDISNNWTIIEGYKEAIKEAIAGISEKHEIPKKFINKMARAYHKRNFNQQQQENEDLATLYETVVGDE